MKRRLTHTDKREKKRRKIDSLCEILWMGSLVNTCVAAYINHADQQASELRRSGRCTVNPWVVAGHAINLAKHINKGC